MSSLPMLGRQLSHPWRYTAQLEEGGPRRGTLIYPRCQIYSSFLFSMWFWSLFVLILWHVSPLVSEVQCEFILFTTKPRCMAGWVSVLRGKGKREQVMRWPNRITPTCSAHTDTKGRSRHSAASRRSIARACGDAAAPPPRAIRSDTSISMQVAPLSRTRRRCFCSSRSLFLAVGRWFFVEGYIGNRGNLTRAAARLQVSRFNASDMRDEVFQLLLVT
ncbi:hypothetical protein B0J13DRAFT_148313 [Dactylonectria estremocensis]|uniref:Uncharacterized protein n=1 Tax=Dactylonectria estremocensis TaxID=1079267 RepID=A0A9P9DWQ0_9HYPO|nr:hypothetical protein B0J13DRAFT_148313 [Dactylonectria estremocensis]